MVRQGYCHESQGLGASVIVCEVDPIKAAEAVMDDTRLCHDGGGKDWWFVYYRNRLQQVIHREHFKVMKDGAILCNAGHFDVEVSVKDLEEMAVRKEEQRKNIMGYMMEDGRW